MHSVLSAAFANDGTETSIGPTFNDANIRLCAFLADSFEDVTKVTETVVVKRFHGRNFSISDVCKQEEQKSSSLKLE